ncbi:hypothetical protein FACS1894127_8030 [Clostridia bacterium]|nr:hypothetical protein FACS1894127_8030 [Clostridia bacterium]
MVNRPVTAIRIKNNMPAVLIEHGFYTNKNELELLNSSAYRDQLAIFNAKGILEFLGVPWIE